MSRFYLTTPLYYVNAEPHLGHAYTTVLADVLARYHRLMGDETLFLTGTDEHGQKVEQAAREAGLDPKAHVDAVSPRFAAAWEKLGIDYGFFIRTTMPEHEAVVARVLTDLWDRGEIYADEYAGWYDVSEERFYTEKELVDGMSPAGNEVEFIREKNYFFRMSKYQQALVDHIEANPTFIVPEKRANEVLGFLRQPLGDLCISRPKSRLAWGIPLPFDADYVCYVWFDALLNYYSALSFGFGEDKSDWWPADLHLIGKDILTTHAVYWPTMLMAAGLAPPRTILAHGWWLLGEQKMSKSRGNVVRPLDTMDLYGRDVLRYFLMREMTPGQDSNFSRELIVERNNTELSNDLGNALNRVVKLVEKHFGGRVPDRGAYGELERALAGVARETVDAVVAEIGRFHPNGAIQAVMNLSRAVNRYLEARSPWKAIKEEGGRELAGTCLYHAAEALRFVGVLLHPVMPDKCADLLRRLGQDPAPTGFADLLEWGRLEPGAPISAGEPLFPRYELETD
ncbi:MAG: methionine--tRNA ligase [Candidatus Krumholzibacteriota bacterium]|nr:methionine--tRNA ligase [Candidatus Krumholzibacteriota bacterium]